MNQMAPEHNFEGSYQEWEERVVLNASHFRVHRVRSPHIRSSANVPTLSAAILTALAIEKDSDERALIYAVTLLDRAVPLDRKDWDHYLALRKETVETGE